MARHFTLTADGGSRGNPGPAGYGTVLHEGNLVIAELYDFIGVATNNVAEYSGLIAGLRRVNELDPDATVDVQMDSKLVVEQMSGRWKIKHEGMKVLAAEANAAHSPQLVSYTWIPREENVHADRLANRAMDERSGKQIHQINFLTQRLRSAEVPTTIYLIRHGETVLTPERKFSGTGPLDPELTENGLAQAKLLAREISKLSPEILIASPLKRTSQTAQVIADQTNLAIEFDPAWYECAFGDWDGLSIEEVAEKFPSEYKMWLSLTSYAPPGGESYEAVGWRVDEAIDKLVTRYPSKRIVIVTHNGVIKQAIRLALGGPQESIFHIDASPCSISTISVWPSDGLRALRSANEQGHLR